MTAAHLVCTNTVRRKASPHFQMDQRVTPTGLLREKLMMRKGDGDVITSNIHGKLTLNEREKKERGREREREGEREGEEGEN